MQITPIKLFSFNNDRRNNNNFKISLPKIVQLQGDTVSFGLEKKSQIEDPFDKIVVEQFGFDISKFKSSDDIKKCCQETAKDILNKNYEVEINEISKQRKTILTEWKNYLQQTEVVHTYGDSGILIIADGITRAMDGGTEEEVKAELCNYILKNGYNTEICKFIQSVNWL